jgi:hypothetical protein
MPLPSEQPDEGYNYPDYAPIQPPLGHDIEHSFATGFGGLFGCGASLFTLLLALSLSCVLNWYLLRSFFTFVKDGTSTLAALKEAINAKSDR